MEFEPVSIDPKAHKEEPWSLIGPEGLIGVLDNYFSFLDARVQIKNRQGEGYYIVRNGLVAEISKNGEVRPYPPSLFPKMDRFLTFLLD